MHGMLPGLLLLGITFLDTNAAICGLLSVGIAYLFARYIGYHTAFLGSGFYTYNALLVGLGVGQLFILNGPTLAILAMASILTLVLTVVLTDIFSRYLVLPILSIPFIIVSSLVHLASGRFSNLYITGLHAHNHGLSFDFLPLWFNAFLKSLGAIVFMPDAIAGLLIALLLLWSSRILLLLALLGFGFGCMLHGWLSGSWIKAIQDPNAFNYILIAMALGGVFLVPSLRSYGIAMMGVALATLLNSAVNVFWAQYGIPIFTLPFTLITLSLVYVLGLANYRERPVVYKETPEATLDHYLTTIGRYPDSNITLSLPFNGVWKVWQGFDGPWTHRGAWRYAYDFVQCDAAGQQYNGDGSRLEHYYCFQQPVLSPVAGRIIEVLNHLPDNPIGCADTQDNWGNRIVIEDTRGYFVELSHFMQNSIGFQSGDWVEVGTQLGLCGNSGYSPQPHIHIQVQSTAMVGSATVPCWFVQYQSLGAYHPYGRSEAGVLISPATTQPGVDQRTAFLLDHVYDFTLLHDGKVISQHHWQVKMAESGSFYLDSGSAKLYFGKLNGSFYCHHMEGSDPQLAMLLAALPSAPLHYHCGLEWEDNLPNGAVLRGWKQIAANLLATLLPKQGRSKGRYHWVDENHITGRVSNALFKNEVETSVEFNPLQQITRIQVGLYLLRHTDESVSS